MRSKGGEILLMEAVVTDPLSLSIYIVHEEWLEVEMGKLGSHDPQQRAIFDSKWG